MYGFRVIILLYISGMQNSAASCIIVSILCLLTAAIIGAISIWQKQVSACMVTGVMYVVSGNENVFPGVKCITDCTLFISNKT